MNEDIQVRPATRADRAQLEAFHRSLYLDYRTTQMEEDVHQFCAYHDFENVLRGDVDAILTDPDRTALLAENGGQAVGYITGHIEEDRRRVLPRRGVVEDWYVVPQARRHGVGRQLWEALVGVFRVRGCQVCESTTWSTNVDTRRVHEALGLKEVEVRYRVRL